MKYLVLETHPGYAVLLDTEGRFVRAANLGYTVGETVTDIVIMREYAGNRFSGKMRLVSGIAAAACICLVSISVFLGYFIPNYTEYGTVALEINPGVRMTVSRTGKVLDLTGTNPDGEDLAQDYDYRGKTEEIVAEELADRAVEMGYLSDGGEIVLAVSADDTEWREGTEKETVRILQEHMEELALNVQVLTEREKAEVQENIQVVITIPPTVTPEVLPTPGTDQESAELTTVPAMQSSEADNSGESDYGDSDDESDDGITDYEYSDDGSSDYDDSENTASDYDESDDDDD